jgi:hypothetical protein
MQWPKPKLITYSFVPDGTSIGGVPSNLQQTLNASFATADWKAQFAKAASAWQKVANVNFTLKTDSGDPLGVSGNMQNDSRFGDIRIGGYPMSGSILAFAYLPPPANGGTSAGDIFFNTNIAWQINGTTYDLMTVAIHELGHALGMGHSAINTAAMWPSYTSAKQTLTTDDVSGIRTIYNSRQNDFFDANGSNDQSTAADDISSYVDSNGQLTLSALDSTTPVMIGTNDIDWYRITVPSSTTGTMVVKMQSAKLSLLSPWLAVYNSGGTTILGQASSTAWGDTVTVTLNNVSAGQVYDIKAKGATTGDSGFGAYGLQVNFGSQFQPPVTAPDTTMAEQADQGGGTLAESSDASAGGDGTPQDDSAIPGVPTFWVYDDQGTILNEDTGTVVGSDGGDGSSDPNSSGTDTTSVPDSTLPVDGDQIDVGNVDGIGDALMINASDAAALDNHTFTGVLPWAPLLQPRAPIAVSQPTSGAVSQPTFSAVSQPTFSGASQATFSADPDQQRLITPLDFSFGSAMAETLTVTIENVSPGQVHDTRLAESTAADSGFRGFGLQVVLGLPYDTAVTAPDVTMVEQANPDSGAMDKTSDSSDSGDGAQPVSDQGENIQKDPPAIPAVTAHGIQDRQDAPASGDSLEQLVLGMPTWQPPAAIAVSRPTSSTGPDSLNLHNALDVSSESDRGSAVVPTLIEAEEPEVESLYCDAVDIALDGWIPVSLE